MAEFRTVQTKIWHDQWFSELPTDGKVLFFYLFTNPTASVSGIYQMPLKFVAFETGIDPKRADELLRKFQADGKIMWDDPVIWVKKMRDYQDSGSPQVRKRIAKDFEAVPDCKIKQAYGIHYGIYPIDTLSIPDSEFEKTAPDTDTDTDTDTETIAANAAAPEPEKKEPKKKSEPKAELLVTTIPHGDDLQVVLDKHFSGLARPVPAWVAFSSMTQRDAFAAAADVLGGEFVKLATDGLARNITQRERLLAWLQGCVRNRVNGTNRKRTQQGQSDGKPLYAPFDPSRPRVIPHGSKN